MEYATSTAQALGLDVRRFEVRNAPEFGPVFAAMVKERREGIVVLGSAFTYVHPQHITRLAAQHRIPAIYGNSDSVMAGGLIAYGPSLIAEHRRAAVYVDKILRGAKPGDPPVEQPATFELALNLKTARALGLAIPQSLLLQADRVIE